MDVTATSPFQALAAIRPAGGADRARAGSENTSKPNNERADAQPNRTANPNQARGANGQPLTQEEQRQVEQLRARDQEVRTHEQAHVAAAGPLFRGGPFYSYQQGPDGKRYAVGGSVKIDTSEGRTPDETIQKAAKIRAAAMAPAEPSSTDRAVAAKASRMEAQARQQLAAERGEGDDRDPFEPGAAGSGIAEPQEKPGGPTAPEASAAGESAAIAPRRLTFAAAQAAALGGALDTFA